jgi:hypothetical protein
MPTDAILHEHGWPQLGIGAEERRVEVTSEAQEILKRREAAFPEPDRPGGSLVRRNESSNKKDGERQSLAVFLV